ncbi:MAG: hypothetical protein R3C16_07930 [Hyphomonadaceae bacterium]
MAIKHGEAVVTESAAICAYLADAFPDAGLAPPSGSSARGPYYRWLFFGAGPVEAMASNHALGVVVPEEKRGSVGYGSREAVIDALTKQAVTDTEYSGRRPLQRRRPLCRLPDRLGHAVRHHRQAPRA